MAQRIFTLPEWSTAPALATAFGVDQTAAYGHFGRNEPTFTWERTDKAAALRADAGL